MLKQIYRKPFGQVHANHPSIYESRIVRSYPQNALPRSKKMCTSSSPRKECFESQLSALANSKKLIRREEVRFETVPSLQRARPKSLDFKNNLFQKLASKLQKQKECLNKNSKDILYQYYPERENKENKNESNLKINGKQPTQIGNSHKKSRPAMRYKQQVKDPLTQRQPIKFNKTKGSAVTHRDEELDFVRTSQSQLKKMKKSLDMSPEY